MKYQEESTVDRLSLVKRLQRIAVYFQQRKFIYNPEVDCHGEQLGKLHEQLTTKEWYQE